MYKVGALCTAYFGFTTQSLGGHLQLKLVCTLAHPCDCCNQSRTHSVTGTQIGYTCSVEHVQAWYEPAVPGRLEVSSVSIIIVIFVGTMVQAICSVIKIMLVYTLVLQAQSGLAYRFLDTPSVLGILEGFPDWSNTHALSICAVVVICGCTAIQAVFVVIMTRHIF